MYSQDIKNTQPNNETVYGSLQEMKKLKSTHACAHRVLFHATNVFPFDLFPDTVCIDENKVDLTYGHFVSSHQVISIPIATITIAKSSIGLLFGQLELETGFNKDPEPIKHLWSKDAVRARRIINGLITLDKHDIDLSKLDVNQALREIEEIGMGQSRIEA